jgi:hypothetical protein
MNHQSRCSPSRYNETVWRCRFCFGMCRCSHCGWRRRVNVVDAITQPYWTGLSAPVCPRQVRWRHVGCAPRTTALRNAWRASAPSPRVRGAGRQGCWWTWIHRSVADGVYPGCVATRTASPPLTIVPLVPVRKMGCIREWSTRNHRFVEVSRRCGATRVERPPASSGEPSPAMRSRTIGIAVRYQHVNKLS